MARHHAGFTSNTCRSHDSSSSGPNGLASKEPLQRHPLANHLCANDAVNQEQAEMARKVSASDKRCARCGRKNPLHAEFCGWCGEELCESEDPSRSGKASCSPQAQHTSQDGTGSTPRSGHDLETGLTTAPERMLEPIKLLTFFLICAIVVLGVVFGYLGLVGW